MQILNIYLSTQTTTHTYLSGPEGLFAVVVKEPKCLYNIQYIHTDHASASLSTGLGSWNTISDAGGNRLQEINFDAWGRRRDPNTWQIISNFSQPLLFDPALGVVCDYIVKINDKKVNLQSVLQS